MNSTIKKILLLFIKLAVSSSLLYYVLSKAGVEKVLSIIKTVNPLAFFAAVLIYIASIYIATIRWRLLIPEEFKTKKLFSFCLIGSFFNTFLPGIIGGDAVKTYYLYREINSGSMSLSSVFMDRYIGFVSLMLIALLSFIFGYRYVQGTIVEWLLPGIVLVFLSVSFVIFGLRFGKKIRLLSEFYIYFDEYRNRKNLIAKTLVLSLIIQLMSMLSLYFISLGLGLNLSIAYFIIFFPIITALTTLPISISGLGVREGVFVLLFGIVGIRPEMATAMSLAWFLSIASGGLVGLLEYVRLKK